MLFAGKTNLLSNVTVIHCWLCTENNRNRVQIFQTIKKINWNEKKKTSSSKNEYKRSGRTEIVDYECSKF